VKIFLRVEYVGYNRKVFHRRHVGNCRLTEEVACTMCIQLHDLSAH